MPRQLEIRTTILAKKSDCVRQERDSNSNNVYPSEVLQMLEDLQKLKANVYLLKNNLNQITFISVSFERVLS